MAFWLFKTEPGSFSWEDQLKAGPKDEQWSGVRNALAQKHMRAMKLGDLGFFYHSVDEKRIVGVVRVVAEIHPDSDRSHRPLELRGRSGGWSVSQAGDACGHQGRALPGRHGAGEEFEAVGSAGHRRRMGFGLPHGWI